MIDLTTFAQNDDDAMTLLCDTDASGSGHEAYADWLNTFSVPDLPQSAVNGILRSPFRAPLGLSDDGGPAATITDYAEAPYGGGALSMHWYQDDAGNIYGIQTDGYAIAIPADRAHECPPVVLLESDDEEMEEPLNSKRYLVQHITSGDVFVIESDDAGNVYAESDALADDEWRDPDTQPGTLRAGLDLSDFYLNALDDPESDAKYRYLTN